MTHFLPSSTPVGDETKHKNRKHHPNRPDPRVAVLSNDPTRGSVGVGVEGWHVDGNVVPVPHANTIIHAVHAIKVRAIPPAFCPCWPLALVAP